MSMTMIRQAGAGLNRGLEQVSGEILENGPAVLVDVVFSARVGILENGHADLVYVVRLACGGFWRDHC